MPTGCVYEVIVVARLALTLTRLVSSHSHDWCSEEILSEGAEILSGIAKVSTAARFRLVTSSVPPGSEVLL